MQLTDSFNRVLMAPLLSKYAYLEVRNGAAVLEASDSLAMADVEDVLYQFFVYDTDITTPGGNRGAIPIRLDGMFEALGWQAVRIDTETILKGSIKHGRRLGAQFLNSKVASEGYEVDNMKRRVALDVEWNAKDGNLDRDLSAYRALYGLGLIDVAVIITREHQSIYDLALYDLNDASAAGRLGTSTTTNMKKLKDRITRGDAGGCPVLAVGIGKATWAGAGVPVP